MAYDLSQIQLGNVAKLLITDTSAHTGNFGILHAWTDCTISALTDANLTISTGTISGKILKAGDRYFGVVTSITLTSGTMLCYSN